MDADTLRSLQAPLKERYRQAPDTARITLRAQGRIGEGVTCNVETAQALVQAGLHPATGGTGVSACSGDMLLQALVACGLSKDAPVGFRNVRLRFVLDTDATEDELDSLLRLTERYCVVYQTLAQPPALEVSRERTGP